MKAVRHNSINQKEVRERNTFFKLANMPCVAHTIAHI